MKREIIVRLHIIAAIVGAITIAVFFTLSLAAEIKADEYLIKQVKEIILYCLPIVIVSMATLNVTGNKLIGKSHNQIVLTKRKRMKLALINGIGLSALAVFLFYRSHYQSIDGVFLSLQIVELVIGFTNLILIGMNIKSGLQLSGRTKRNIKF